MGFCVTDRVPEGERDVYPGNMKDELMRYLVSFDDDADENFSDIPF